MAKFKKGDAVKQVMPAPITGTVADFSVDRETGDVQILVEWSDQTGTQSTYFTEDQIEKVT